MLISLIFAFALARCAFTQQIWDVWETTWDRRSLLTRKSLSASINFSATNSLQSTYITVSDSTVYQTILGFGATLTDASAHLLNDMKGKNSNNYWNLLRQSFDMTDGANAAGLSYIRVALGATDFSASVYSYDDSSSDNILSNFYVNNAPWYLFSVLRDILSVNSRLMVHLVPWSPPAWMKTSGSMNGGSLIDGYISVYPTYLLKAVQGFSGKGVPIYAISIQNEPQYSTDGYPSCWMPAATEAQIGRTLRTLLDNNGYSSVRVIAYEHNWNNAATYPVEVMQGARDSFAGAAFHCYEGSVGLQESFHSAYPDKEIYFTECSGTLGSDWWQDIKWYMDNLWIGSLEHWAKTGLMWNFALDGNGNPKLPGSNSCTSGCRGVVTINNDGTYSFNQEYYSMAQASKAIIPKDWGGPFGQRIGVTVGGSNSWALRVGAYATGRASASDWVRYSLVVLNWDDSASSAWNPVPVTASIEFRGVQATYTFQVGVTTLWWFAAPLASRHSVRSQWTSTNTTLANSTNC
ncbi:glycoside hydrolase family 30 protein [Armillaria novae-zelandiae]|uniref:Glycoside hydrolase family 30 protein n=1 Tax=Armillaria novae-zelandiae TaxID=153914 RepID=A0AA39NWJ2_9AGAR|nr:glycoside hydrolase family 30 protein [Armillaria novae-zelandiae]